MNEKSKAFELIEFVWDNEKTDSYLRVNIAMYEAVKLAIISQMKFNKEDFQNIFSKFSGGYWFGVNANGKGYGENFYREAVTSGNISACQSYEALFPDEIMPVDINLLQQEINEGYIMLSDGRYLPPKEAVQQCYNAFGIRVGLGDNWEDIYDGWNKEMK